MQQISFMADDPQPECVWRKAGRCAYLFIFLADRFVGAPDTVIDCESIHAQWQRLGASRRNLKLLMLNALVKLRNFVCFHGGIPDYTALEEHIEHTRAGLQMEYAAVAAGGGVRGSHRLWHNAPLRFNLRPVDIPPQGHLRGWPWRSSCRRRQRGADESEMGQLCALPLLQAPFV